MANGRAGRPAKPAVTGERASLTIRLDGEAKNLIAEMAAGYGLTIAEYLEALARRDRAGATG